MKRYFFNLMIALLGRNPYQEELDGLKEKYEKAGENVRGLNEMYYNAVEKWSEADKQTASLQTLVENLRERIREKDALIGEYQKQINEITKNQER